MLVPPKHPSRMYPTPSPSLGSAGLGRGCQSSVRTWYIQAVACDVRCGQCESALQSPPAPGQGRSAGAGRTTGCDAHRAPVNSGAAALTHGAHVGRRRPTIAGSASAGATSGCRWGGRAARSRRCWCSRTWRSSSSVTPKSDHELSDVCRLHLCPALRVEAVQQPLVMRLMRACQRCVLRPSHTQAHPTAIAQGLQESTLDVRTRERHPMPRLRRVP